MAVQFAVRFALIAFAVAQLRGAIEGGDFPTATKSALIVGGLSLLIGFCIGELAGRVTEESARREFNERIAEINQATNQSTKSQ